MRKFLLIVFLIFAAGFYDVEAQNVNGDSAGVQFEFQAGLVKFSMDGEFDNGDFAWGAVYQTERAVIEPAVFITSNIDLNATNKEEIIHLGTLLSVQIKRTLSLGLYYDFWKSGIGLTGWRRDNSGFMFSYDFNF